MKVTDISRVVRISPCDLQNGNYKHDFKRKPNPTYSGNSSKNFNEIFENERLKLQNK